MKIEKVNDNQIKCTLTKEDLENRHIKLSELAYGTEKAKLLFRDMMQLAFSQFGFEAEDIPLMIEAIPVSRETVILIVTKVEDPEELDTRFSKFAPDVQNEMEEIFGLGSTLAERADEILDMFRPHSKAESAEEGATSGQQGRQSAARSADVPDNNPEELVRSFTFRSLDFVIEASHVLAPFFRGSSTLYKDSSAGTYLLRIGRDSDTPENFNKACNILSEYGTGSRQTPLSAEYLEEHFEKIVASDVIAKLATV